MPASWVDMAPTAKVIVEQVLGIQKGEQVAILTDTQRPESITQLLATAVRLAGAEAVVLTMKPAQFGGVDPQYDEPGYWLYDRNSGHPLVVSRRLGAARYLRAADHDGAARRANDREHAGTRQLGF